MGTGGYSWARGTKDVVDEFKYMSPIGTSDHVGLLMKINIRLFRQLIIIEEQTGREIMLPWKSYYRWWIEDMELDGKGVDEAWIVLRTKCNEVIDKFVPLT